MKTRYRYVSGSMLLVFAMLPAWSLADPVPGQQRVEQPGLVSTGAEQGLPAWVEPPVGPYRFFPPQPAEYMTPPVQSDRRQAEMMPGPAAGYPDYQNAPYPSAAYPAMEYPGAGQQALPYPNNGYAYEYQYQYQRPAAGMYGYDGAMPPPAGAYNYGNYPRSNYPADMRPDNYPYGSTGQMPVQPYYR